MFKAIKVEGTGPQVPDILREINRGSWSIGYTGQSPERLRMHMENQRDFARITLKASSGPCAGDYYGLPWPCWGPPEMKHPGSPNLYDYSRTVKDGGGAFRARFGVERNGVSLLADGVYPLGSEIKDGYPEFTMAMLKKLGWDKDLTPAELAAITKVGGDKIDEVSWQPDLSGGIQRVAIEHGCAPGGNAKARAKAWDLPGPIPAHREPLHPPPPAPAPPYPPIAHPT